MNWLTNFLKSSIGKKLLMSLTGLFLCSFLIVHVSGNLQLFRNDGGYAFNHYTAFMSSNPVIRLISYGLYTTIVFHAFWGLYLVFQNKKARPVQYATYDGSANSHWSSRWMGVLGTVLLAFICLHMWDFWGEYKFGNVPYAQYERNLITGETVYQPFEGKIHNKVEQFITGNVEVTIIKNLYIEVEDAFSNIWVVLFYVVSMAALSFHLYHGFNSAFQTLGINHRKYNGLIKSVGVLIFGMVIPILFALMPLYFLFK